MFTLLRWMSRASALLTMGGLCLAGCRPEEPAPPPSPTTTDARGDWEDMGRYATCGLSTSGAACGDFESFDLAGCDRASLGGLPRDGVFTLVYRIDAPLPRIDPDAFRVSADGSLDSYQGMTPTQRRVDAESFFLSSVRSTQRDSLVGCRAEGNRLYGCFVSCRGGRPSVSGTFLAEKWERRAGEAEASGLRLESESFVDQGMPVDVYVTQGHAYVVSVPDGGEGGGLTVFDVSDKRAPVLKKTIALPTDNYWNGVWSKGNALYVASASSGVIVFDISKPEEPRLLRSYPGGRIDVHTVFVEGDRLYAMSPGPQPQTLIFDIGTPTAPVLRGMYAEPGATTNAQVGYPHDALAYEGRLYINHWSGGYLIVDVGDPEQPRKLSTYTYPYATSHANAVGRFGERLIAFEGGENWGAHLRVLDVTEPTNPHRIGEYELGPSASIHNMVLKGERLYIAHYQHGVRVLDVSEPEKPREVGYFNTYRETDEGRGGSFYDGAIGMRVPGDGYLYVIDTARGLLILPEG
ncbi:LVIVD repeat-containing protein [Archangium lipolyticum]|uniref:LVIVD repeat-containing protein n=1 Tax=Archangium lipolyticum TaxID=2970465 RepID=UPI00214A2A32|nr:hypothetical protein [Archangium lipolyticum]